MKLFLSVIGLLMVVEGLPYFAFPEKMQVLTRQIEEMDPDQLRLVGLVSILIGLAVCYLAQRTDIF
ncbi:MAG: DUF2065 domain-containing protein [Deltaproteobacteria bacterium]|nr:DUF2065 domain-containing protein [Deltaproteobacteria bacterium]MBW1966632.1 DUF2065 domain-containing protein [Deltaproteobacteria bacterium]MBW2098834.1 DUF2065 domain-containing protein [Deltaproteobacteria bacterium]